MELTFDAAPPTSETNAAAERRALEATRRPLRERHEVTVALGAFEDGFRWVVRPANLVDRPVSPDLLDALADELGGQFHDAS